MPAISFNSVLIIAGVAVLVPAVLGLVPRLLVVRGLPALLYRRRTGTRRAAAAGLLQATTLTFVIVATQIGLVTGKITPTVAASLVAAGLLTAALFPAAAQRMLSPATPARPAPAAKDSSSARAGRSTVTPGEEGELLLAILSAWEQAIRHHQTAGASMVAISGTGR